MKTGEEYRQSLRERNIKVYDDGPSWSKAQPSSTIR